LTWTDRKLGQIDKQVFASSIDDNFSSAWRCFCCRMCLSQSISLVKADGHLQRPLYRCKTRNMKLTIRLLFLALTFLLVSATLAQDDGARRENQAIEVSQGLSC